MRVILGVGLVAVVAGLAAVGVLCWLSIRPEVGEIEPRLPGKGPTTVEPAGTTHPPAPPMGGAPAPPAASTPSPASAPATAVPPVSGAWPRFRGANFDNISTDPTPLARRWGPQGPPRLWSVQLGEGYAAPAIINGRVYVLDYDQTARADRLRCFSLATGQELWSQAYAADIKRNHGFSRTVPALTEKRVVTMGPKCHVMCCDAVNGQMLWEIDLPTQFGATVPEWYTGQCPLIDGNRVILAPGGTALMIAVDLESGNVVWQTPNPRGWKMTHSSIIPIDFAGQRMYVYCASGGVVGVSAKDGSLLWETSEWTVSTANVPTPVNVGNGKLFLCGGYRAGAMMLGLRNIGGRIVPEPIFRLRDSVYGSQQQTPILYKGYIYGTSANNQLVCLDLNGNLRWSSGATRRFGLGPYIIADGLLFVLHEDGELFLVDPSPSGYKELARAKVLDGPEAWGPLAIAGGRLLARDLTSMVCLDVRAR